MHHSSHPKKKKSKCSKHSSRIIKKESHYVFPSSQVSVPHNLLKRPLLWLKNSKSAYCVVQVYIIWVNGKRNLGVLNTFLCAMFIKQKKKKKLLEALWSFVGQYPDHSKYTVISAGYYCKYAQSSLPSHTWSLGVTLNCKIHSESFGTYHVDKLLLLVLLMLSVKTALHWH